MLGNEIFWGYSSTSNLNGGIILDGKGDTLTITLTDMEKNKTTATLRVYNRQQLQRTEAFQRSQHSSKVKQLYLDWHIVDYQNKKIVYNDDFPQTFICTTNKGFDFEKLLEYSGESPLLRIRFFQEVHFLKTLNAYGYDSVQTLRQSSHLGERQIECLMQTPFAIQSFQNNGIHVNDLSSLTYDKFSRLVTKHHNLNSALQFVTKNQLLGIDNIPLTLPGKRKAPKQSIVCSGSGSSLINGFQTNYTGTELKAEHLESESHANFKLQNLSKDQNEIINKFFVDKPSEKLVHLWKIDKEEQQGKTHTTYYSSELSLMIIALLDEKFPMDVYSTLHRLYQYPYFAEKNFFANMKENHGYTADELRAIDGMSESKIELMYDYRHDLNTLLKLGVSIHDLAKVDEQRLDYIFSHFQKAQSALQIVNVFELLNMRETRPLLRQYGRENALSTPAVSAEDYQSQRTCTLL